MRSNYNHFPSVSISEDASLCRQGWEEIGKALRQAISDSSARVVAVEVYPGIDSREMARQLGEVLKPGSIVLSEEAFQTVAALRTIFSDALSDDPVFSVMRPWTIDAYFDPEKVAEQRQQISAAHWLTLVVGAGASYIATEADIVLCANLTRWEIQQRQRAHAIGNLGLHNSDASPAELYKTAFFLDWRVADRIRHAIYQRVDFFVDMNCHETPSMLAGDVLREAVKTTVQRPFRLVPFFDPGPWGGQWMRERFDLPEGPPNYAWGFDCVPEENSVLFDFGGRRFELPAIVLVHEEPELLLGATVQERFGAEFPIRFDFLDTVQGGNLSLQVHPSDKYICEHFGMAYTQDESYYMLHCEPGSSMYLGIREGTDPARMTAALYEANRGGEPFPVDEFVERWPTRAQDHFSIPAGTVHCSGEGNVVLEISATPYIFTFKLWDWGRSGLDGRPRPVHLGHGLANIRWDRTTPWVRRELVDQTAALGAGDGWREERTGLHASQFLETRRHWFTKTVPHNTQGNLHVLNLVEGSAATVSSPDGEFAPFEVHFAETFIVPASVGAYEIAPSAPSKEPLATLKAYVRG